MSKSVWLKGSVKVAALTVAFAASGTGAALAGTPSTSGNHSILGGNQINVPISVPVNVCGNAIAVLGQAFGLCQGGASVSGGGSGGGPSTSGNGSIGGGNQVSVPISVPVNVCGNSVAVLGRAASACQGGSSPGTPPPPQPPGPLPGHHHHHHHMPPPSHHRHGRHGGTGSSTGASTLPPSSAVVSSSLPTTGANFAGLLALAAGVTVSGAGTVFLMARRGLLAAARRTVRALAACRA